MGGGAASALFLGSGIFSQMCSFPWLAAKPYFYDGTKAGTVIFHHLTDLKSASLLLWKRHNFSGRN